MADQNPTADPRVVPVDLPDHQIEILSDELLGWLAGIEEDLESADRLPDPGAVISEADAFRRLLTALDDGEIEVPDPEARSVLGAAAEGYDEANAYTRIVAVHDAHHALLAVLDRGEAGADA
jgi:hypothetical protein